jgi:hypothetical protein
MNADDGLVLTKRLSDPGTDAPAGAGDENATPT